MKKVGFVSLGCPKNLVDSEVMMGQLAAAGYDITNEALYSKMLLLLASDRSIGEVRTDLRLSLCGEVSVPMKVDTGATVEGRLLARDGAFTLDTNVINRPECVFINPRALKMQRTSVSLLKKDNSR